LLERGATVRTAASRPEALALLDDFRPEVLISDLRMPERDGYVLLDEIRGRGVQVGAILLTGYADAGTRQTALARGFDLHLTKPIDPDELVHAVSTLLNTSRSLKM
jgi:CheY-like chemotaxis protein